VGRTILHVDMDAFFAAVEQRDHPEYAGKPVIVGSDPKEGKGRGIVSTCSYEARKYGVHSAQPISRAWKLCPHGIYVLPDMEKYARVSDQMIGIFFEFTDLIEQVSIDEAFLDVTGSEQLYGSGGEIALKIKERIRRELKLTASVGMAGNKFVAKVASDLKKPDGLVVVQPGHEREFLAPLPVGRLWGVGPKTEAVLRKAGIERIGQIAELPHGDLIMRLGKNGAHLWQLAHGIDDRPVVREQEVKSIGHEFTFEQDTGDRELLKSTLLGLSEKVSVRLRAHHARARTITVKYREADFSTYTRRVTLEEAVDTAEKIFPAALGLLNSLLRPGILVRLIGVSGSNLVTESSGEQMEFFSEPQQKDRKLASAMDAIVRRFGDSAITRAALVKPAGRKTRGN